MLVDLKPSGDDYMEDFHAAGGMPRLLAELTPFLDLTALSVAGTLAGVAASWALLRLVRGLLYDVAPADPTALGAAAAIMIAVALIAGLGPAARAARTDPMLVLRSE